MKDFFLATAIFVLLVFGVPNLSAAQVHDLDSNPYWDPRDFDDFEWQQYVEYVKTQQKYLKQRDWYDERHVMQFRPYRKPQPDPYPPCCIPGISSEPGGWQMNGGTRRRTPETIRGR